MSLDTSPRPADIDYPETDGQPMGDSTIQIRWILKLFTGVDGVFLHQPDVFVAANLFWYPVQGSPSIVTAPDVLVAFGRPKGDRSSYKQWAESGIAPQVVFEVLSLSNTPGEMEDKFDFYQRYGVEEYYIYDPFDVTLQGFRRSKDRLGPIARMKNYTSPRLGIRFDLSGPELQVFRPDGEPFRTHQELMQLLQEEADKAQQTEAEKSALAAKLRELGIDPDSIKPRG
jgi:Uma2 family endonuclease